MKEVKRRKQPVIPTFGNWESCDEIQITRYFESARQAGLLRAPPSFWRGEDRVDPCTVVGAERKQGLQKQFRSRVAAVGEVKQQGKHTRVCDVAQPGRRRRAPRAVDEDLYKIPAELLYRKPKTGVMMLKDLWNRCTRLNCVFHDKARWRPWKP